MYHKWQLFISYLLTSAVCSCVVPYYFGGDRSGDMGVCAAGRGQCVVRMSHSQNKVVTQISAIFICALIKAHL